MSITLMVAALASQMPPPIVSIGQASEAVLVEYEPGAVTCDGIVVPGTMARPLVSATTLASGQDIAPFVLGFRIGADGRPLGIVQAPRPSAGGYLAADDLQPALAASRFAAGQTYERCTIRYVAVAAPIATAPVERVFRYIALPHTRGYLEQTIMKRVRAESPGCFDGKPLAVRNQAFPDFNAIPQPPGALSMTVVEYDIDAAGKPVRLRTLVSDGNAALDAAARAAIGRSRYSPGVRTGCTYPFHRRQATPLAPPPPPPAYEYRASATCEIAGRWDLPPRLTFPEPFRRRAIEGWAVIRYDVAPWGQTGNVTILASEPAAAFGEQARQIIQASKRPASASGGTGCVERVRFKLPEGPGGVSIAQMDN